MKKKEKQRKQQTALGVIGLYAINAIKRAYFKGFARTLWPMVTKLVSWFDINQAREETLWCKCHVS